MKKLTRKSLSELAMMLPVVENEIQTSFVGGGAGTRTDPFTLWEWEEMGTSFRKGWVEFSSDTISYLKMDYYSYFSGNGYDDYYNDYYNDEGSTSLYNDTDHYGNVSDFPDMDLIADALLPNQKEFYYQLKNSGQFAAKFVKPGDWEKMGYSDIPSAKVIIKGNVKTIYITYNSKSPDVWEYQCLLRQELFHIYQDQLGLRDTGKYTSTIEYQENLMNWGMAGPSMEILGGLERCEEYWTWWENAVKNQSTVNLTKFLEGVDKWYEAFIDYFKSKNLPENHPYIQDRNKELKGYIKSMKWKEVLEWYGYNVE